MDSIHSFWKLVFLHLIIGFAKVNRFFNELESLFLSICSPFSVELKLRGNLLSAVNIHLYFVDYLTNRGNLQLHVSCFMQSAVLLNAIESPLHCPE